MYSPDAKSEGNLRDARQATTVDGLVCDGVVGVHLLLEESTGEM